MSQLDTNVGTYTDQVRVGLAGFENFEKERFLQSYDAVSKKSKKVYNS